MPTADLLACDLTGDTVSPKGLKASAGPLSVGCGETPDASMRMVRRGMRLDLQGACSAESLALGRHSPTEREGFAELLAKSVDVVLAGVVHGLADDKHNVCFGADR